MGIIELASGNSCWRGLDYYKDKKVADIIKISDTEYKSTVNGEKTYNIYLNLKQPRKSTCDCPFADGRRVICKHIVATYFTVVKNSAKEFEEEQKKLEEEYEKNRIEVYAKTENFINSMTKKELISEVHYLLNYSPDWMYEDFIKRYNLDID